MMIAYEQLEVSGRERTMTIYSGDSLLAPSGKGGMCFRLPDTITCPIGPVGHSVLFSFPSLLYLSTSCKLFLLFFLGCAVVFVSMAGDTVLFSNKSPRSSSRPLSEDLACLHDCHWHFWESKH